MTKQEFDKAMVEGWKELDYQKDAYFDEPLSLVFSEIAAYVKVPTACCALGAVMWYMKETHAIDMLPKRIFDRISRASDKAGNKEAAIATVKALQW